MKKININPTKDQLSIGFKSNSLHVFGFVIIVYAEDNNTVLEQYSGSLGTNDYFEQKILLKPINSKGKFINVTFKVNSPVGDDYDYALEVTLIEDNKTVLTSIEVIGKTVNGKAVDFTYLHLN
jgi:hypothetical protein